MFKENIYNGILKLVDFGTASSNFLLFFLFKFN